MDVRRKKKPIRRIRLIVSGAAMSGLLVVGTMLVAGLDPSLPEVDANSVVIEQVEKGLMLRRVGAPGRLVSNDVRWVTAPYGGRVTSVVAEPGSTVEPDTVLAELGDPKLEQAVREAERDLAIARGELADYRIQLAQQTLDLKVALAEANAAYDEHSNQAQMDQQLAARGLISVRQLRLSLAKAEKNRVLLEVQFERAKNIAKTQELQLEGKQAIVDRAVALLEDRTRELASLTIVAGRTGILEQMGTSAEVNLEVGQQVLPGEVIAKITNPNSLKARLRVPETQARHVAIGQPVSIDTRSAVITGLVTRIDPAVLDGEVTVDTSLVGELPNGLRPDLSVDGLIEVERLPDVVYCKRPVFGEAGDTVTLFKYDPASRIARRQSVRLGRTSVTLVEIISGLKKEDHVVVSDMSSVDEIVTEIRIR